jgi:hypothetical protein
MRWRKSKRFVGTFEFSITTLHEIIRYTAIFRYLLFLLPKN